MAPLIWINPALSNTAAVTPPVGPAVEPAGPAHVCWGSDATGAGLVTADAALGAIP